MAQWMVTKGAQHIVLISRSGSTDGKVGDLIKELNALGANIVVRCCNVADRTEIA